jgi:hypothetical protein
MKIDKILTKENENENSIPLIFRHKSFALDELLFGRFLFAFFSNFIFIHILQQEKN